MLILTDNRRSLVAEISEAELKKYGIDFDSLSWESPEVRRFFSALTLGSELSESLGETPLHIDVLKPSEGKLLVFITAGPSEREGPICVRINKTDDFFSLKKALSDSDADGSASLYSLDGALYALLNITGTKASLFPTASEFGKITVFPDEGSTLAFMEHAKCVFSDVSLQP